jgi:hypothetical protein
MNRLKWEVPLVMALAVALALAVYGLRIANPHDISWMHDDTVTGQFGWEMYRGDPDNYFPVATNRYSWPLAMPLAMFDTMPAMALVVKLLVPASQTPFQYVGPLFLIGIALQALFGWLSLREATREKSGAYYRAALVIGALFIATTPALLVRFQIAHMVLTQQWLLLAALWLFVRSVRVGPARTFCDFTLLIFAAATFNTYLMVMALMFYCGFLLKLAMDRALSWKLAALAPLPFVAGVAAMLVWGFIDFSGGKLLSGEGYQVFSANLYTLFDPKSEWFGPALLPDMPAATGGQYEGFGYLGLGGLLLVLGGVIFTRMRRDGGEGLFSPLALVIIGAFVLALSTRLTFGPYSVFLPVPDVLVSVLEIFRSSGRFIWVVIYALLFVAIAGLIRGLPERRAAALLGVAALIQVADLTVPLMALHDRAARTQKPYRFEDAAYASLGRAHDRLLVLRPWQCQKWETGKWEYPLNHFQKFSWLAIENGLPINSFYAGRTQQAQMTFHCSTLPAQVLQKPADPRTAYLISASSFAQFGAHISASHFCDFAEDMFICRADMGKSGLSARASAVAAANSLKTAP